MRMKRRAIAMSVTVLLALLPILTGLAAPLDLTEDLKGSVRIELTDQAQYIYSYAYPQVDPADSSAELINTFYQTIARDAEEFEIPMNADYYREQKAQKNITVEISYEVTCNNDDFFSVLLNTRQGSLETYTGHTFSRKGLKPWRCLIFSACWRARKAIPGCRTGKPEKRMMLCGKWSGNGSGRWTVSRSGRICRKRIWNTCSSRKRISIWMKRENPCFICSRALRMTAPGW